MPVEAPIRIDFGPEVMQAAPGFESDFGLPFDGDRGWEEGPAPLLLDALGVACYAAYALRKLRSAYTGFCIKIRRTSDNTPLDIGFVGEDLDVQAIVDFVGSNSAYVVTIYDQSGNGRHWTQNTTSAQPRIRLNGVTDTKGTAGKPTLYFPDSARGFIGPLRSSPYTGTTYTMSMRASISSTAGTGGNPPRFGSLIGATQGTDYSGEGASMAERSGSTSPAAKFSTARGNGLGRLDGPTVTYGTQYTVHTVYDGTNRRIVMNGGESQTSGTMTAAFNVTRASLAHTGAGYASNSGGTLSEVLFLEDDLTDDQIEIDHQNKEAYYDAVATVSASALIQVRSRLFGANTPNTGPPDYPHFTRIFYDAFDTPVAEGSFLGSSYGQRWGAYPNTYVMTNGQPAPTGQGTGSHYNPSLISVSASADGVTGNVMKVRFLVGTDGKAQSAAPWIRLNGNTNSTPGASAILYGRWEERIRIVGPVQGWKIAHLLWPFNYQWVSELDFPECNITNTVGGFLHWQNDTNNQYSYGGSFRLTDWHTYAIEWIPGRIQLLIDGLVVATFTDKLPAQRMFWIAQNEERIKPSNPATGLPIAGQVSTLETDYVAAWAYAA